MLEGSINRAPVYQNWSVRAGRTNLDGLVLLVGFESTDDGSCDAWIRFWVKCFLFMKMLYRSLMLFITKKCVPYSLEVVHPLFVKSKEIICVPFTQQDCTIFHSVNNLFIASAKMPEALLLIMYISTILLRTLGHAIIASRTQLHSQITVACWSRVLHYSNVRCIAFRTELSSIDR